MVNDRIVNIPSYLLKPGDKIKVRDKSKKIEIFHENLRKVQGDNPAPWLSIDKAKMMGIFENVPERSQIPEPLNEQLVVELYSK
jgi:small subunit ribosomal protein S4